jgi:hypothetical protein
MLVPAKVSPQIFIFGLPESFRPRGQPISQTPANKRDNQYMFGQGALKNILYQKWGHWITRMTFIGAYQERLWVAKLKPLMALPFTQCIKLMSA